MDLIPALEPIDIEAGILQPPIFICADCSAEFSGLKEYATVACKPPWLPNSPCPALAALPSMGHRPQPTPTLVPLPGQLVCTLPILMLASSLAPPSYPLFIASQAQDLKL